MSDLGSEELEEEGENDLGVRASRGVRWWADPWRPGWHNREEDHASHCGRCVLEVGGERKNVMTSACLLSLASPYAPLPLKAKISKSKPKSSSLLLPSIQTVSLDDWALPRYHVFLNKYCCSGAWLLRIQVHEGKLRGSQPQRRFPEDIAI